MGFFFSPYTDRTWQTDTVTASNVTQKKKK